MVIGLLIFGFCPRLRASVVRFGFGRGYVAPCLRGALSVFL
jgi:hypothetical protein